MMNTKSLINMSHLEEEEEDEDPVYYADPVPNLEEKQYNRLPLYPPPVDYPLRQEPTKNPPSKTEPDSMDLKWFMIPFITDHRKLRPKLLHTRLEAVMLKLEEEIGEAMQVLSTKLRTNTQGVIVMSKDARQVMVCNVKKKQYWQYGMEKMEADAYRYNIMRTLVKSKVVPNEPATLLSWTKVPDFDEAYASYNDVTQWEDLTNDNRKMLATGVIIRNHGNFIDESEWRGHIINAEINQRTGRSIESVLPKSKPKTISMSAQFLRY